MTEEKVEKENIKPIIEALLFVSGNAVKSERLKNITSADLSTIRNAIDELNVNYRKNGHSLKIIEVANGFQIVTQSRYGKWIRKLLDKKTIARVTPAGLEVLAIIAYEQPVTKSEIEKIRGVNSDSLVQSLMENNMVKIMGRAEELGRPFLYGTTDKFLEYFALKSLKDLPDKKELEEVISEKVEEQKAKVENILGTEIEEKELTEEQSEEVRQKKIEEEEAEKELDAEFNEVIEFDDNVRKKVGDSIDKLKRGEDIIPDSSAPSDGVNETDKEDSPDDSDPNENNSSEWDSETSGNKEFSAPSDNITEDVEVPRETE